MSERQKLAGIRLGLTYGAGLVLLGLVVAMIATPAPVAAAPVSTVPIVLGPVTSGPAASGLVAGAAGMTVRQPILVPAASGAQRIGFSVSNVQASEGQFRMQRRVFRFTPVPGHELPALMLPPPAARGLFIAAHADRAVAVSAPK